MTPIHSFLDFLTHTTSTRIRLHSDDALAGVRRAVHETAARLRGYEPLVFRAGPRLDPGGSQLPLRVQETTLSIVIGRQAWGGGGRNGLTVREVAAGWRTDEEMYVAYGGGAGGALLLTRRAHDPLPDTGDASFGFWTYDAPLVRMACMWVGTYLASLDHGSAITWNAALSLLAARQPRPPLGAPPAPPADGGRGPGHAALGQDIRAQRSGSDTRMAEPRRPEAAAGRDGRREGEDASPGRDPERR